MTQKHTPGPWEAVYNADSQCWEVNTPYDGLHCPTLFEGDMPDARLIAAAPELLAACLDAEHAIQILRQMIYGEKTNNSPSYTTLAKLREAIAKAEGTGEGKEG